MCGCMRHHNKSGDLYIVKLLEYLGFRTRYEKLMLVTQVYVSAGVINGLEDAE